MKKLLLVSICFLASCSKDDMPKYSSLDRLRVLALVVNTPEIQNPAAGITNVTLDPYISDLNGTGNVTLEVQSCLDPGVNLGSEPTCQEAQFASAVQTITVTDPVGQAAGVFGSPERTGRPSSGSITVGLQIPAGFLATFSAALQYNGIPYLITVTATRGSESVRSFRRVLISNKTPNNNPTLSDLLVNGSSLSTLPSGEVELSFTATGSPENYQFLDNNGDSSDRTELYETTWFVSDGEIDNPRSALGQTITWKAPDSTPAGRQSVMVGVLRDGRGGAHVLIRKL